MWIAWLLLASAVIVSAHKIHQIVFKPLLATARRVNEWIDEREEDHETIARNDESLKESQNSIEGIKVSLAEIKEMVYPDSGNSLFDRVVRLEGKIDTLIKRATRAKR